MGLPVGGFSLRPALEEGDSICFLTVLKRNDSGYAEELNLVINDGVEWQTVWEKVFANESPKPPLPEVDFTHRTIIAAFQGARPTGGFEISVEQITETETSLQVVVKAFEPRKTLCGYRQGHQTARYSGDRKDTERSCLPRKAENQKLRVRWPRPHN